MDTPLTNEQLRAMRSPDEERSFQDQADRLTDQISRMVRFCAKEGKTNIPYFSMLTSEILTAMVMRQLSKRFPDARITYETKEGSEVKIVHVDWSL